MAYDNRANILSHALQLFAARGYDAVSVQEIVEAAGVTKPTLYHYFGSKRGLLDALLAEHFDQLDAVVEAAAAYHGDLWQNLHQVTAVYFDFALKHRTFYRMQLSMCFAPPDSEPFKAVIPLRRRQHRRIEAMFVAAVEHHGNMRGRHKRYAATLVGTINTYITLALNGEVTLGEDLRHNALHQFMHGIYS